MDSLLNRLIANSEKPVAPAKVKPKSPQSLRAAILSLVETENQKTGLERRVSPRSALTVASRSLDKTKHLDKNVRLFVAYRDVASFLSLAHNGAHINGVNNHLDLLPVGHPLAERSHFMTSFSLNEARARWIAADPRIDNSVRELVASAYSQTEPISRLHAFNRIRALTVGLVPQELAIDSGLQSIVAGGNDSFSRSLRARMQRRDRHGRFAEEGGGMQFFFKDKLGKIFSVMGRFAGNSASSDAFIIEVHNDENLKDGLYVVPTSKAEAILAVLPQGVVQDLKKGAVGNEHSEDAVDVHDLKSLEMPDGWEKRTVPGVSEDTQKIYQTDDGYTTIVHYPVNGSIASNPGINKVSMASKQLKSKAADDGSQPWIKNYNGENVVGTKHLDMNEPVYVLYRSGEGQLDPVAISQSWADTQAAAEKDQDSYDKAVSDKKSASEKAAKEKAEQDKADLEQKNAAYKKQADDLQSQILQTVSDIKDKVAKNQDQDGNPLPEGWSANLDESSLPTEEDINKQREAKSDNFWVNYVAKLPDPKNVVTYTNNDEKSPVEIKQTSQGFSMSMGHLDEDGIIRYSIRPKSYKSIDEAAADVPNYIKETKNNIISNALEQIKPYDSDGKIADLINSGASPDEIKAKLEKNPQWKSAHDDYETSWAVDLPKKDQKEAWDNFGRRLNAIESLKYASPASTTPGDKNATDENKESKSVLNPDQEDLINSAIDSLEKHANDKGTTEGRSMAIGEVQHLVSTAKDHLEKGQLQPAIDNLENAHAIMDGEDHPTDGVFPNGENAAEAMDSIDKLLTSLETATETKSEPKQEVKAELPAAEPTPEKPSGPFTDWKTPPGAYKLQNKYDYEPQGRIDEDSSDFNDDPKVIANKFPTPVLISALGQALIGNNDITQELIDEINSQPDEDVEEPEAKGKPGPKKGAKKKAEEAPKKITNASGSAPLEFKAGEEYLPAEAIYDALKEQGEDADSIVAGIYDSQLGQNVNGNLLKSNETKQESINAESPTIEPHPLDEILPGSENIEKLNAKLAEPMPAAYSLVAMEQHELDNPEETNQKMLDLQKQISSIKGNQGYAAILETNIDQAFSDNPDDQAAFKALWGLILSNEGGDMSYKVTEEEKLKTEFSDSLRNALKKHNGTVTDQDILDFFDKHGDYAALVKSRMNVAKGVEDVASPDSLAGNFYRLMLNMKVDSTEHLFRGFRVDASNRDLIAQYTTVDGIISIDPRPFSSNVTVGLRYSGSGSPKINEQGVEESSILVEVVNPASSVDTSKFSMFYNEDEHIAWGNFKVLSVKTTTEKNGRIVHGVKVERLSPRDEVLERYSDDYQKFLINNEAQDLPEGYHVMDPEPYVATEGHDENNPDGNMDDPLGIARNFNSDDLVEVFRGAIEDGSGTVNLANLTNEDLTNVVPVEAVRDALQIQGIDTNEILKDIANTEPGTRADTTEDTTVAESIESSPVTQLSEEIGSEYDLSSFKKIGSQKGSNEGGTYENADGDQAYIKTPKSDLHAQNEVLASALYRLLGVDAAEMYLGSGDDGKIKTYSPLIPEAKSDLQSKLKDPEYLKKLQDGFAVDAWLANWDVAGLAFDNVVTDANGDPVRVDPGGALLFRAMGSPKGKAFGDKVTELDTLRDPKMNPQSSAIFGSMTDEQQKESARKLLDISNDDIGELVHSVISDPETAANLVTTLEARRYDILDRYGLLADDTSTIVDNAKIEEPNTISESKSTPTPELPKAEAPKTTSENKKTFTPEDYVTSDGVQVEIGMTLKHKKTGVVGTVVKYDKGNNNYIYLKSGESKPLVTSLKQLETVPGDGGGGEKTPAAPKAPEAPEPQAPEPEIKQNEEPKLQLHAQWVKDIAEKNGVNLTPAQATEIVDKIAEDDLIDKWSGATDQEILDAVKEVVGPQEFKTPSERTTLVDGVSDQGNLDNGVSYKVEKASIKVSPFGKESTSTDGIVVTLGGNTYKNKNLIKDAGFKWDPENKVWSKKYIELGSFPKLSKSNLRSDLEKIGGMQEQQKTPKTPEAPTPTEPSTVPSTSTEIGVGHEVTDAKGNTGIIQKINKDNYAFVQFPGEDKPRWRSLKTLTSTGNVDNLSAIMQKNKVSNITGAGVEPVVPEKPADWSVSEFDNIPSLQDAISKMATTNDMREGQAGVSVIVDSDSLEDLDVHVFKVKNEDGSDGVRLKFKLTNWAGNERTSGLLKLAKKSAEEREAYGFDVKPFQVDYVKKNEDGSLQIDNSENGFKSNDGSVYTITTKDGIVVKFHRGNNNATSTVKKDKWSGSAYAFHNMVTIQAPADVTTEQISHALAVAGVQDVRPSTPADAKILIENRLMSIFDKQNDPKKNLSGAEREASLKRVETKYGITSADVTISTGASGRIETNLSDEAALKLWEAVGKPTALHHGLTYPSWVTHPPANDTRSTDERKAEFFTQLLSTPQGGLLSTTTRWTEGIGGSGMSSPQDVATGGADYVFTTPKMEMSSKEFGVIGNQMVIYFDPKKVYKRLDFFANVTDKYGARVMGENTIYSARPGVASEIMFKQRLSWADLDSVITSPEMRSMIMQRLHDMGISEIGGRAIEDVVLVGKKDKNAVKESGI